jgi:hypothetical protein
VVEVRVDGADGWLLAEHLDEARAARPSGLVRLLPAFDHYVVAAPRDGQAGPDAANRSRVYRPQGWLSPVVLVDGRIAGVWRHERAGRRAAGRGRALRGQLGRRSGQASRPRPNGWPPSSAAPPRSSGSPETTLRRDPSRAPRHGHGAVGRAL